MQEEDPFEEDFGNTELIGTKLTLEVHFLPLRK